MKARNTEMTTTNETVYVVRDASGEYLAANGKRTQASDEAREFDALDDAKAACTRTTDRVLTREI